LEDLALLALEFRSRRGGETLSLYYYYVGSGKMISPAPIIVVQIGVH
jgi:hypothetical protein